TSFPAITSLEGLLVPQVARQQFSMQFQCSDPNTATIALQFRAASSQFDDDQNQLMLRGFATFDLYAQHRFNRSFSVFAAVENLFNTRIEAGRTPILTLASPRFFRAGIRLELSRK